MAIDDLITMTPVAPPEAVEDLADLRAAADRLTITGKTRSLGRLAEFPPAEAVWVLDANQAQFDAIVARIDPLALYFNGLRAADLSSLGRFRRLELLDINWNTKVTDISFVAKLTRLRLFSLVDCCKVQDLSAIAGLSDLEILDLGGGMWSTFKPDTLAPLAKLAKLRGLSLKAIRVGDESLAPVAGLKALRQIELSNQFPMQEYARLSVAFPDIDCPHFQPYLDFNAGQTVKQVMITGKRGPVLSLPKDAARLERYVQKFRVLQEQFRAEA